MFENLTKLKNCGIDLVNYVVIKDFKNALEYHEKDDLVGYGLLSLVRYAHKYDPTKGTTLETFCIQKAKQGILSFLRQKCQQRLASIEGLEDLRRIRDKFLLTTQTNYIVYKRNGSVCRY